MQQDSKEVWQCLAVFREAVSRYISQRDNQLQVMKRKRDLAKTVRLQQLEEMNSRDPTRRAVGKAETYIEDVMRNETQPSTRLAKQPPTHSAPDPAASQPQATNAKMRDRIESMSRAEDATLKHEIDSMMQTASAEFLCLERAIRGIVDLLRQASSKTMIGEKDACTWVETDATGCAEPDIFPWAHTLRLEAAYDSTSDIQEKECDDPLIGNPFDEHFLFQRDRLRGFATAPSTFDHLNPNHMQEEEQELAALNARVTCSVWKCLINGGGSSLKLTTASKSIPARHVCPAVVLYLRSALKHMPHLLEESLRAARQNVTARLCHERDEVTAGSTKEDDEHRTAAAGLLKSARVQVRADLSVLIPYVVPAASSILRRELQRAEQGQLDERFLQALRLPAGVGVTAHHLQASLFGALNQIVSASNVLMTIRSALGLQSLHGLCAPSCTALRLGSGGGNSHVAGGMEREKQEDLARMFTPRTRRLLFVDAASYAT